MGLTVIIMQISVQIVLNWNWPTGTELGNILPSHLLKIVKNMNRLIFFLVGQIKSGRFKLGLVNLGQVKWGHVKLQQSGLIKSSQNRSSQFGTSQIKLEQL